MSSPSLETKLPPLVRPDLSFDEAAIEARAAFEFDAWRGRRTREHCAREARRAAQFLHDRMASGAIERDRAAREAEAARWAEFLATETPEQREARHAAIIRQCSTDGRLS